MVFRVLYLQSIFIDRDNKVSNIEISFWTLIRTLNDPFDEQLALNFKLRLIATVFDYKSSYRSKEF